MIGMDNLMQTISPFSQLNHTARQDFLKSFETKTFEKGNFILGAVKVSQHFYFIKKGLTKSFFHKDDKEFIMTFFKENMIFTEFSSYLTQRPSKYMIVTLEDTILQCIHKERIDDLCRKHHCIEALFSKFYSFGTLGLMKRISEMLEENATERYKIFMKDHKELIQRISLGDLANYLGITQVSLSRIRAKK
jgi:signal-transduction protein with cAMP-binding, CBS, and nucleotidyltransferase domain